MALPKKYKPTHLKVEDTKYVIAYQSSQDKTKFNCHSHSQAKVKDILKVRPLCNTSGKKLNNLPVILKLYLNKKGIYKQKILYFWYNRKQLWKLNEGVI